MLVCPGVVDAAGVHVANVNVHARIVLKLCQLEIRITKGNFTFLTINTDFAAIDAVALEARVALAFVFSGGVLEDAPRVGVARVQVYVARLCALNLLSIQKCVVTHWKFCCLEMR
jgi:hypothetical protein